MDWLASSTLWSAEFLGTPDSHRAHRVGRDRSASSNRVGVELSWESPVTTTRDLQTLGKDLTDAAAVALNSPPGDRVTHPKGVLLTGTFTATPRARELTRAAHMQGDPVRVTCRFSNGFPDPNLVDAAEATPAAWP
jgi:hypothetical protein